MSEVKQGTLNLSEKGHKAFRHHKLDDYITDSSGAQRIVEEIVGSSVRQSTIHFAARIESAKREENGKAPCFLNARSVAFFDIAWVKEWAKQLKAKRNADNIQISKKAEKIDAIKKQIDDLFRRYEEIVKEAN